MGENLVNDLSGEDANRDSAFWDDNWINSSDWECGLWGGGGTLAARGEVMPCPLDSEHLGAVRGVEEVWQTGRRGGRGVVAVAHDVGGAGWG